MTLLAFAAIPALLAGNASASGNGNNSDLNHTSYYEALGYGTCEKIEDPGDPFVLGDAPAGSSWTLLVLKAGSAASNDDWNTMIPDPTPGPYLHPSGKDLSHVIFCHDGGDDDDDDDGGGSGSDDDDDDGQTGGNDDDDGGVTTTSTPGGSDDDDGPGHGDDDDDGGPGGDDDDDGGQGTTTTTTTTPGGPCDDYTPTQVTVNPSTVAPADTIVITGIAVPGDTVTANFETSPGVFVFLGDDVADGLGQFSITAIVPVVDDGDYNIVVASTDCPTDVEVTVTVQGLVFTGCGSNNDSRTLEQGQSFVWNLHVPSFDTSKPVKMRLYKGGTSYVLYDGAWPASSQLTMTIPVAAPTGKYTMEQTGTRPNGKSAKKKCPVWVELASQNTSATVPLASTSDTGSGPLTILPVAALVALGTLTLVRLRVRPSTR